MPSRHHSLFLSLGLGLLAFSGNGIAFQDEHTFNYEAHLSSQVLQPEVTGESRRLDTQIARLHLREEIAGPLHGGLIGGFPSIRWSAPAHEDRPRMGGWQLGLSLGGRHPRKGALAFSWEAEYNWTEVNGILAPDEALHVKLQETAFRAGLEWRHRAMAMTTGLAQRRWDGEERIDDNGRGNTQSLSWRPKRHPFLDVRLRLDQDGWLGLGVSAPENNKHWQLYFGRGF